MTEFVTLPEILTQTAKLAPLGEGRFAVPAGHQAVMLHRYLNIAQTALAAGLPSVALPKVIVHYRKVTKAAPRIGGEDYRTLPGISPEVHIGRVTSVGRNKKDGQVFFRLADDTRIGDKPGFTACRLEGVVGFSLAEPALAEEFLARTTGAA